jgi:hypothetical protein
MEYLKRRIEKKKSLYNYKVSVVVSRLNVVFRLYADSFFIQSFFILLTVIASDWRKYALSGEGLLLKGCRRNWEVHPLSRNDDMKNDKIHQWMCVTAAPDRCKQVIKVLRGMNADHSTVTDLPIDLFCINRQTHIMPRFVSFYAPRACRQCASNLYVIFT